MAFCRNCGGKIPEMGEFCPFCGVKDKQSKGTVKLTGRSRVLTLLALLGSIALIVGPFLTLIDDPDVGSIRGVDLWYVNTVFLIGALCLIAAVVDESIGEYASWGFACTVAYVFLACAALTLIAYFAYLIYADYHWEEMWDYMAEGFYTAAAGGGLLLIGGLVGLQGSRVAAEKKQS